MNRLRLLVFPYFALWAAFLPSPALAYIGPGAGLGAIAVVFALVIGLGLLIVGLVWFPLKRKLKRLRSGTVERDEDVET